MWSFRSFCAILSFFLIGVASLVVAQDGKSDVLYPKLFCGTDESGFDGMNGELAEVRTKGSATVGEVRIYDLDVPLNGITFSNTFLWAGQPEDVGTAIGNTLRQISIKTPPTVLSTLLPGANSFSSSCCNEQMVVFNGKFYHAHYGDVIQRLVRDSSGNSEVAQTWNQADVVGMATDGVNIWITNWSSDQVGTWDPATNIFTPVFTTPSSAGALAWDVANGVLWVGMEGGSVIPYDATGKQLGSGFQPFGSIGDTIDGLAFVPASGTNGDSADLPLAKPNEVQPQSKKPAQANNLPRQDVRKP